ncbi:Protein bric-a-brac 2 [Biomphalaria pfeifferi]|uniref:Protein bric-a-brac 2 n=1 Tax=Biomphalaria pfeifferi TaxID=112525 RepID=A0AAD8BAF5_BIOPF|nr:Protein bric-a-brac 2 [Biomphalaria pfeifferi]
MRKMCDKSQSIADVINQQYKRYLQMNMTNELSTETESARLHNIYSEEVIGMFSAAKKILQNATIGYISSRICGKKNKTLANLDSLSGSAKKEVVEWAIGTSRTRRQAEHLSQSERIKEMVKRAEQKCQQKEQQDRSKVEKILKRDNYIDSLKTFFPNVTTDTLNDVQEVLCGRSICHC